jgi:PKD repeat protein
MKRLFTVFFTGSCLLLSAQHPDWCASDHKFYEALSNNPAMQIEFDNFNAFVAEHGDELASERAIKVIPVVVHIIHNYGPENIPDAQVADAIRYLNEDYLGTSADLASVIVPFQSIVANPQFEFRLATKDPNGNCTNGITRTWSGLTYDAGDNSKVIVWPRNKYYNIWVVYNIYSGTPGTITAGFSYFPSNMTPSSIDGTIVGYQYCGENGSNFAKRVLSHETGHWFNLAHTFGNVQVDQGDCSGTDYVSDTPPTPGSFSTCNLSRADCGSQANVQNIMDYSSCTNMFTTGQKTRLIAAANSATAGRNNLWTGTNLTATGTTTVTIPNCAPVADFHANRYSVCAGTSITFYDNSWNAHVTSRLWTFTDGITTINDTAANPTITFNNAGVYDVTLTASSPAGNDSEIRTDYVYVYSATANYSTPVMEDFESNPITSGMWTVLYNQDPADGWRVTNSAYISSNTSMMVHNYALAAGETHSLISPSYDFTTITNPVVLTFKYAYAQKATDNTDELKFYGSTNCGQTWQLRATYDVAALLTGGTKTSDWYPNSLQWSTKTLSTLGSYVNKPNVRFKFEFTSGGGNNLFIEDINITGTVVAGIEDAANNELAMNVYPNPVQNQINIDFTVEKEYDATFRLIDIAGKQLAVLGVTKLLQGDNHFVYQVPTGTTTGLYFLQVEAGGKVFTHKIIIE